MQVWSLCYTKALISQHNCKIFNNMYILNIFSNFWLTILYFNSTQAHTWQNLLYSYAFMYISLMMTFYRSKHSEDTCVTNDYDLLCSCWVKWCMTSSYLFISVAGSYSGLYRVKEALSWVTLLIQTRQGETFQLRNDLARLQHGKC